MANKKSAYKTEGQLKAEAQERKQAEALLEQTRKPRPKWEKSLENFWYHYKVVSIASLFFIVVAVFIVKDIFFRTKPDISIVASSVYVAMSDYAEALRESIISAVPDYNSDGKKYIELDFIANAPFRLPANFENLPPEEQRKIMMPESLTGSLEQDQAYSMKQAAIVAAADVALFLLDELNYSYLDAMDGEEKDFFVLLEGVIPGAVGYALPFKATIMDQEGLPDYFENIAFYVRDLSDWSKSELSADALDFLKRIAPPA